MENAIVIAIIVAAVWYLGRRAAKAFKTDAPSCGCGGGCDSCPSQSLHMLREKGSPENGGKNREPSEETRNN